MRVYGRMEVWQEAVGITSRRGDILKGYSGSYWKRKSVGYQRRRKAVRGF
jgi:hypothetical protein